MRMPKILFSSVFPALVLAGTASAQITITNVLNAASRVVNGSLAQGALIAVQGRGVGTSEAQQATFPLPSTDGLGGVTIQIASGGQFFDGIMVYTKPNEVGAILPSAVPVGPATLTVNNNGATASKNINVIDAAFGIFTQRYGLAAGPDTVRRALDSPDAIEEIRNLFLHPEVTGDFDARFSEPDFDGVIRFLCDEREFSRERVEAALRRAFGERSLW